ncbi:hypothetical protein QGM71_08960 [Virgibacillus sp. C22-A2]|uniref:Uncharacterized protein n=1 Tax=Virgibacillus tibetensis TaxID=3042313 RepID=A0ABU6KGP4_9BACI|nr:hypothetical protein [Virgibacillus sp. C22-A2]
MNNDYHQIYELCKSHMHSYVLAEMVDGSKVDGIITGLDDENVYFAVPLDPSEQQYAGYHENMPQTHHREERYGGFGGYPGYGAPGFGFPGYGFGRPPFRFRRLVLPLAALAALSVLPWY